MDLTVLWFILITVLFVGFFFLEGFDYGVGTLLPLVSPREEDRRLLLASIAPVWDGNEVWMITAGGALFAAFPHAYATMFSTFYLALFLMLLALILRGVAFELRGKEKGFLWQRWWDRAIFFGSAVPALLWGVAMTDLFLGLPIDEQMIYRGGFLDLLQLPALLGGLVFLTLFAMHGANFLLLRLPQGDMPKLTGGRFRRHRLAGAGRLRTPLLERVRVIGSGVALAALVCFALFLVVLAFTTDIMGRPLALLLVILSLLSASLSGLRLQAGRGQGAFVWSGVSILLLVVGLFAALFPRLMVSSLSPAYSLTIANASSSPYTLAIMTACAVILVPIVLIYQAWSYWVFRKRVAPTKVATEKGV